MLSTSNSSSKAFGISFADRPKAKGGVPIFGPRREKMSMKKDFFDFLHVWTGKSEQSLVEAKVDHFE
jgi:hypothetical protein